MSAEENEMQGSLLNLLETRFPSRENMGVFHLARIGEGWENDVYSFRVGYDEGGERRSEDLILRIYPGDDALEKSFREFNTMRRLHQLDFPVPNVLLLDSDRSPFGKPFVIMEKIDGRLMGDVFFESPRGKRRELITQFCKMLVDLHNLKWEPFVADPSAYTALTPQGFVQQKLSQAQERFHSLGKNEFDDVLDWLKERTPHIRFGRLSLVHWDYHPWNVLLGGDGAAFVIDWSSAEIPEFRFDLGWTLLLVSTHAHRRLGKAVLREYERIACVRIDHVEYFEVAACLRRLFAVLVSFTDGPTKVGMRPGAEAEIRRHVVPLKRVHALLRRRTGITIPKTEALLRSLS
ncbi:MAG: phosphotransferase family protein [bacterium]